MLQIGTQRAVRSPSAQSYYLPDLHYKPSYQSTAPSPSPWLGATEEAAVSFPTFQYCSIDMTIIKPKTV